MPSARHEASRLLAEHAVDGLIAVDEQGAVIVANPAARAMLGLPDEPVGTMVGRPPADGEEMELELVTGRVVEMRARAAELDGRPIWVLVVRDVTLRRQQDAARRVEEQRLKHLFESTGSRYLDIDLDTGQVTVSSAAADQLGLDPRIHAHSVSGLLSAFHPQDAERFEDLITSLDDTTDAVDFDYRPARDPQSSLTLAAKVIRSTDGRAVRLVGLQSDTSSLRERLTELEVKAFSDSLTGLANRDGMARWLESAEGPIGVIAIDLDAFKTVNDTHGHAAGDELLKEVAQRLLQSTRGGDLVARSGGDEFVVLTARTSAPVLAEMLARISRALNVGDLTIGGVQIALAASVGAATAATPAEVPWAVRTADRAMYRDKQTRTRRIS